MDITLIIGIAVLIILGLVFVIALFYSGFSMKKFASELGCTYETVAPTSGATQLLSRNKWFRIKGNYRSHALEIYNSDVGADIPLGLQVMIDSKPINLLKSYSRSALDTKSLKTEIDSYIDQLAK